MTDYSFDWVDAFSATPFGGNGCAVVYDDGVLPVETCLAYTRETSLVECTFVGPSDVADFNVRYFVASHQIPFAGHPTIATVASLLDRGLVKGPTLTLETGAGVIPIAIDTNAGEPPLIRMTQNAPMFGDKVPASEVAAVVGLTADDILGEPQVVSTGLPFCITEIRDLETIKRAKLDISLEGPFANKWAVAGEDLVWPYLVTREGADQGATFARLLLGPPMPPEDPFTGSATGAAAAYLWANNRLVDPSYIAEQGHFIGRPGKAQVRIIGEPNAISGIEVAGNAHVLMSGKLRL